MTQNSIATHDHAHTHTHIVCTIDTIADLDSVVANIIAAIRTSSNTTMALPTFLLTQPHTRRVIDAHKCC